MDKHQNESAVQTTVAILAIFWRGDARGNELTAGPRDATGVSVGAATSDNGPTLVP